MNATFLTDEQKRSRALNAKKLYKNVPKYSKKSFNDLVTVDKIWVYYFKPKRKCSNRVGVPKNALLPSIAKRWRTVKIVWYVIFF